MRKSELGRQGVIQSDSRIRRTSKNTLEGVEASFNYAFATSLPWPIQVQRFSDKDLQKTANDFFEMIVARRAIDDWDPYSLIIAARLARLQAKISQIEFGYLEDDRQSVCETMMGGEQQSAILRSCATLQAQTVPLMRAIGIAVVDPDTAKSVADHARAARTVKKVLDKAKAVDGSDDDRSLLA